MTYRRHAFLLLCCLGTGELAAADPSPDLAAFASDQFSFAAQQYAGLLKRLEATRHACHAPSKAERSKQ